MVISLYQTLKTTQKSVDKCPTSFGAFGSAFWLWGIA